MKEIYLIRHGESQGNVGMKTVSTVINPLTDLGKDQAVNLSEYLVSQDPPGLVVVSKYQRAKLTACPFVNNGIGSRACFEEWAVHEFHYLSDTKYANTSEADRAPARYEYWTNLDPDYRDDESAESFNDFMSRAERTIRRLFQSEYDRIYVFSHGQFIKLIWLILINEGLNKRLPTMGEFYNFSNSIEMPNTGILNIKLEKSKNCAISQISPPRLKWS